jgi:hypothetical protein
MKATKSVRLKKYGSVYNSYVKTEKPIEKRGDDRKPIEKRADDRKPIEKRGTLKPEKTKIEPIVEPVKSSKRNLNDYQKFVKDESGKDKYKNMKGSERMLIISKEWERKKKRKAKK